MSSCETERVSNLLSSACTKKTEDSNADLLHLIDLQLRKAIDLSTASPCPAVLANALRYAVFPGGARIRPQLCLAVARACGDQCPELSLMSAAAIELYHCASLVQDDLPCFDNAETRRGREALHRVFSEPYAVLVGDGLLILACDLIAGVETDQVSRRTAIQRRLLRAVGPQHGLVAGQAWESEPSVKLSYYHACKTTSLFEAATSCGAMAAGADDRAWSILGSRFGTAYQIADDIADLCGNPTRLGKPVSQDRVRQRPNIAAEIGIEEAIGELARLLEEANRLIPECTGQDGFRDWLLDISTRILTDTNPLQATSESHQP
ncbi:MAG TPA: polyprenyl synthetase family protein [Candidatus Angelobacter sp.]